MQVWKIDSNNVYTGESYFVEKPSTNEVNTPITVGYVKPKWNGSKWIEGATEQEIQEWKDSQIVGEIEPTEEEVLQKQKELTREQTTLAVKLIAPTFSDEVLTQIPLLVDEWAAGVEYVADKSVVRYEDVLYRVVTSHRSQSDWPPSDVPALYKIIEAPGEIGPWRQPLGEHDAYQTGDKVKHKEQTWVSTEDDNVWEPGVYGWEITT